MIFETVTVVLPSWLSILVLVICVRLIARGRVEIATGIYLSQAFWLQYVMLGPISITWPLLFTMLVSGLVYAGGRPLRVLLPVRERGIVFWLAHWWLWILILIYFFRPPVTMSLLRALLLYIIPPSAMIVLFGRDLDRVRRFAFAFSVTSLVGCGLILNTVGFTLRDLLHDPALTGVTRLGRLNYHYAATPVVMTAVFLYGFVQELKNIWLKGLLAIGILFCGYYLVLAGSREGILGVLVALFIFSVWGVRHRLQSRAQVLVVFGGTLAVTVALYQLSPALFRFDPVTLAESEDIFHLVVTRLSYIQAALRVYFTTPVWGAGFMHYNLAHNPFIEALVDQGLPGLVFFIGFLLFVFKWARGTWAGTGDETLDRWRAVLLCQLIYTLLGMFSTGGVLGAYQLYAVSAFIWRVGLEAQARTRQTSSVGAAALRPTFAKVGAKGPSL
jgi:hypothetical protein